MTGVTIGYGQVSAQDSVEQLEETAIGQAVARISNSVIRFETIGGKSRVDGQVVANAPASGLVMTPDGYALSASFHFANQPSSILAWLPNGQRAVAEIVGRDESRKIVLLKIQTDFVFSVPPITTPDQCRVGQTVIAVGRAFDAKTPNISTGIISAKNRIWDKAIQTDAKISPANFGGPLLDLTGKVIGILVPMNPDSDNEMAGTEWYDSGIGFAVPISDLLARLDELKSGKTLRRGLIGVSLKGGDLFADPAVVAFCPGSSPAGKSGVRPDDQIVEINGKSISRQSEMKHALGPLYEGDVANVVVMREGQRLDFNIELTGEMEPFLPPGIGLTLGRRPASKLVVETVAENGAADIAGVKQGDRVVRFDGRAVGDFESFRLMIAAAVVNSSIKLTVERDGEPLDLALTIQKLEASFAATPVLETDQRPPAKLVEIKVADVSNPCFAIMPEQRPDDVAPALLVWIPEPGKLDKTELEKTWLEHCQKQNVVLLVPESTDAKRWSPDEIEFVVSAVDKLAKQLRFDPHRVVVGGMKTGGSMASLIAAGHRDLFRGLVLIDSGLSQRVGRFETSPVEPLMILLEANDLSIEPIKASIEILKRAHIPFHAQQYTGGNVADWINDVLNWVNNVDRL